MLLLKYGRVARGGFGLRSATVGAKQTSPGRLAPLDTTP